MKAWIKAALFWAIFFLHLALTFTSVLKIANCGILEGCVKHSDYVWNQAMGFPIFSLMSLFSSSGSHYSGEMLTILLPLNSLVFVGLIYLAVKLVVRVRKRGAIPK
ncbi:hypothetical protein ABZR86_06895 [Dyella marensis]|uniref:hypothetical protein n=1 Tax=Dyella TaxID=231454 RepID=UPI0011608B5A|nr:MULTISPECIES: hypothetical protein [Dyella]